jgi:hypothetical protein
MASVLRSDQAAVMPAGLKSLAGFDRTPIPDDGTTKDFSNAPFVDQAGNSPRETSTETK